MTDLTPEAWRQQAIKAEAIALDADARARLCELDALYFQSSDMKIMKVATFFVTIEARVQRHRAIYWRAIARGRMRQGYDALPF